MAKMGLEIVSFNIQNIDDAGIGVINNLGIANTVAIQKSAEISRANAEKEIAVAQANANLEANEAQVKSETAIAERQNALAIKKAELRKAENQKEAEAMKQYGEAAILETALNAYVEMSKNIVSPLEKIDSITMYGDGNQAKLVADTTKTLTQLDSGISDALGIDIKSMLGQFMGTKLGVQSAMKTNNTETKEETPVIDINDVE